MEALEYLNPPSISPPLGNYTQVVKYGPFVWISGQVGVDQEGKLVGPGDPEAQTQQIYHNIELALGAVGASLDSIAKTTTYVVDRANVPEMMRVRARMLKEGKITHVPASVLVIVDGLQDPKYLVEVDAIAVVASE